MIVQADAVSRKTERCDRVEEACRKTSQAAVSKRRFRLDLFDLHNIFSVCLQKILHLFINAKVDHIVGKKFSDKKLCRDIVKFFLAVCTFLFGSHILHDRQKRIINLFV